MKVKVRNLPEEYSCDEGIIGELKEEGKIYSLHNYVAFDLPCVKGHTGIWLPFPFYRFYSIVEVLR